jgi:hypothetical protein
VNVARQYDFFMSPTFFFMFGYGSGRQPFLKSAFTIRQACPDNIVWLCFGPAQFRRAEPVFAEKIVLAARMGNREGSAKTRWVWGQRR